MRQRLPLGSLLLCLIGFAATGQQVSTFNYRGGAQGKVTFDHGLHAAKGFVCVECHLRSLASGTQLFQTAKQGLISLPDHRSNRSCFACHNGNIAFFTCEQCHR